MIINLTIKTDINLNQQFYVIFSGDDSWGICDCVGTNWYLKVYYLSFFIK